MNIASLNLRVTPSTRLVTRLPRESGRFVDEKFPACLT